MSPPPSALVAQGCCCPVFSISIARLHLMDSKRIRPDPWDYQIIAFSNCLQVCAKVLGHTQTDMSPAARGTRSWGGGLAPDPAAGGD